MTRRNGKREAPLRVAGYVRVSALMGREGDDFHSPEVQREKIEAWATYRGAEVVHWYVDLDVSGTGKVRRPEFERMLADSRDHGFDVVAVYRLTRFARSSKAAGDALAELEEQGVGLVSVTEDIDTTTPGGKFVRTVLFATAEFEADRIAEDWRNVHARRRQRGLAHVPSGAYGFVTVDGSGDRTATIQAVDDGEAAAVRLMFRLRDQGAGYGAIQAALEREGFRSPRGHARFAKGTILAILRNPIYAGLVRLPDGELIEGQHEAIVPRELWDRVQARQRTTNTLSRHRSGALLAGLLVCHSCGYRLRYEAARGKKKARYRCPAKDLGSPCKHPVQIAAERVESYVEAAFLGRFDPSRFPNGGRVRNGRPGDKAKQAATRARSRVVALDRALDALADARFVSETISAEQYMRQSARLEAERAEAQQKAEEAEQLAAAAQPLDRHIFDLWAESPNDVKRRGFGLVMDTIRVLPFAGKRGAGRFTNIGERLKIGWTA